MGVPYVASENGGAQLIPASLRKSPIKWDKAALRDAGLLPVAQEWIDALTEAGVPMVIATHFSGRDIPMPTPATGKQSGRWAEAWVYLALSTWGKRSNRGMVSWLKKLMTCEKERVVIVMEALMLAKHTKTTWHGPAKIWLDQQRTCANTCPYLG